MWPYLEQFALEAGGNIRKELGGHKPDLIIGNYSDGNLVATLLAYHLNVTQCTIAHALEKTKYANADIHWYGILAQLPTTASCKGLLNGLVHSHNPA